MISRLLRPVFALALLGTVTAACADNEEAPLSATVIVETSPSTPLELVISTRFTVPAAGQVVFTNADTIAISGNYTETFALNSEARFTAKLGYYEDGEETARMSVLLDDRLEYDETATMVSGGFLQYLYRFQQQVGIVF